jgi:hypothetical protein
MGIRDFLNKDRIVLTPGGRYPKSQVKAMEKAVKAENKRRKKKK